MCMSTDQLSDELCIATTEENVFEMGYDFALQSVRKLKILNKHIQNISGNWLNLLRPCPHFWPCGCPRAHVVAEQIVPEKWWKLFLPKKSLVHG